MDIFAADSNLAYQSGKCQVIRTEQKDLYGIVYNHDFQLPYSYNVSFDDQLRLLVCIHESKVPTLPSNVPEKRNSPRLGLILSDEAPQRHDDILLSLLVLAGLGIRAENKICLGMLIWDTRGPVVAPTRQKERLLSMFRLVSKFLGSLRNLYCTGILETKNTSLHGKMIITRIVSNTPQKKLKLLACQDYRLRILSEKQGSNSDLPATMLASSHAWGERPCKPLVAVGVSKDSFNKKNH